MGDDVMKKTIYIVTGALGHVGRTVVRQLGEKGCRTRGFALLSERDMADKPPIDMFYGDVREKSSMTPLFAGLSAYNVVVIHTAGIVSIASRYNKKVYDVNVNGTKNVVELCVENRIKKLVYVSSVHAIPELENGRTRSEIDDFDPEKVHGLYAKTKAAATRIVLDAAKEGLDASVIHPSGILGPYDPGHNHLTQLILDYVDGRLGACVTGGYDFVDVRDVAECIIKCAEKGRRGECYICSNKYLTVIELMQYLHEITGLRRIRVVLPMFFAKMTAPFAELYYKILRQKPLFTSYSLYTLSSNAKFSRAKADRELTSKRHAIKETLADTINWLKENGRFKVKTPPRRSRL
jgi:dihydroflavonol-4-reductase